MSELAFSEVFGNDEAAELIRVLGERCVLELNGTPKELIALPVDDDHPATGGDYQFAAHEMGWEVPEADLPEGWTRDGLIASGKLRPQERRVNRDLSISDVRDTGQGIQLLVCQP